MQQTPDPEPLGRALAELIARRGIARTGANRQLAAAWKAAAGDVIARQTRPRTVRGGTLLIDVAGAALLQELVAFHKSSLLASLKREYPQLQLRGLQFRLKSGLENHNG